MFLVKAEELSTPFLASWEQEMIPITHGSIENFKTEISFIEADKCYKFTNFSNLHFLKHLISCTGAFSAPGHRQAEDSPLCEEIYITKYNNYLSY